ncbi:hypothetical protein [Bacteroides pyogenes]|uniref:hypothetical protein n=1 Tax=Bacteroides pyogenes TaxID=310300 RepID=UPI0011C042CA|nr:hypothetical protein [Bacteroides pyogenes]MBB3894708.1 hypothetical protein [Bacteroides pyogenes]
MTGRVPASEACGVSSQSPPCLFPKPAAFFSKPAVFDFKAHGLFFRARRLFLHPPPPLFFSLLREDVIERHKSKGCFFEQTVRDLSQILFHLVTASINFFFKNTLH